MSYTSLKYVVPVAAALSGFATEGWTRCVSDNGAGYTASEIAQLTLQAHRNRRNAGNWDADNKWPFGENGPHGAVRVGRFDFSNAVEGCERQHQRTGSAHTGLTCNGRDVIVISRGQTGLVCKR